MQTNLIGKLCKVNGQGETEHEIVSVYHQKNSKGVDEPSGLYCVCAAQVYKPGVGWRAADKALVVQYVTGVYLIN
jgi:hypothetical protein